MLQYKGKNLLQHALSEAVSSYASPVIVVLGANSDLLSTEIDKTKIYIVENTEWEEGMASSVRIGVSTLLQIFPSADAVIFMVCDQPYVSASILNDLINTQVETGKLIVTSDYGEAMGPPALFHKSVFAELMELKGDAGARKIIEQHGDEVGTVLFPGGAIDIDTKADYNALS